ncbi:serine hydrolase domain-containing protein [Thalassobaculum sp.]|uniref:serine hydrolase domain-containing protein n=1 Tax=Thalassobaculum sp. TaxID=2022740 RepID=UPI0032EC799B
MREPTTAGAAAAIPERPDPALAARVDPVLDRFVDGGLIVGAVTLIARDGALVYRRALGLADRENGRPMTVDTPMRLASVTKPFVSVAALALAERGTLDLDAPVNRWLPAFRPRLADGSDAVITVRHLLTHTSGLGYGFFQGPGGAYHTAGVSDGIDRPGIDLDENLRRLASVPLMFQPGSAWLYSLATDVLGRVLEQAAGQRLSDVVRQSVTDPLGLSHSGFIAESTDELAVPYADTPDGPVRMSDPHSLPFGDGAIRFAPSRAGDRAAYPSGGAGMVGTAPEALGLLETLRAGGGAVLSTESVAALTTNHVGDMAHQGIGAGWGFGLGVAVLVDPVAAATPQTAGTWRWGGVYGHNWFVDPAAGLTVVTMTNTAVSGMNGPIREAVRDAVYAAAP